MTEFLLVLIGFSAIFILILLRRTKSEIRLGTVLGVAATAIVALLLGSAVLLLQVILTLIVLLLCGTFHVRPTLAAAGIVAAAVFAYAAVVVVTVRQRHELLREFPVESIADRLEYETRTSAPAAESESTSEVTTILLPTATAARLATVEQGRGFNYRRELLRRLHDAKFASFVVTEGFGPERMLHVNRWGLETPKVNPVFPPQRPKQAEPPTAIQNPSLVVAEDSGIPLTDVARLHDQGLSDFSNSSRIGYVKARQQVAGFVPHVLTQIPTVPQKSLEEWQVSVLGLVSLLKFDSPRVYLSEHLPRMDELRNAETRALDEFEQRALPQLREGEDIVIDQQLNTIRMMGAVRAAKQCLDCHSVRRGDLLGAFSYLLDRKQPISPPNVEGQPVSMLIR